MVQAGGRRLPLLILSPSSLHSSETSGNTGISVLLPASQYISAQSLLTSAFLPYAFCITGEIWGLSLMQRVMGRKGGDKISENRRLSAFRPSLLSLSSVYLQRLGNRGFSGGGGEGKRKEKRRRWRIAFLIWLSFRIRESKHHGFAGRLFLVPFPYLFKEHGDGAILGRGEGEFLVL